MQENENTPMEESSEENIGENIEETENGNAVQESGNEPPVQESSEDSDVSEDDTESTEDEPRQRRKISLFSFWIAAVSLVVATVMITFTVCTTMYRRKLATVTKDDGAGDGIHLDPSLDFSDGDGYIFGLIKQFMDFYSFEEIDHDLMRASAIKAFVAATGDRYAYYYTAEELEAQRLAAQGQNEGIGINIIEAEAEINGATVKCMQIVNVTRNSPAEKFGLLSGDLIYGVGIGESMEPVDTMGYEMALVKLVGKKGTTAEFTVKRPNNNGYETIECRIVRETVTEDSVLHRVHSSDPTVGIVKVIGFDLTTPTQFSLAMDDLISKGCTKFVFDMRYNPGGDALSVKAVLSYFLKEGDVVMRTKYKSGAEEFEKVGVSSYNGAYAGCSVSAADIGKYKKDNFQYTVLCNESTASAGELFTATFRDYNIGKTVGTKTFGKGSMQTMYDLSQFGYEGALKLTVAKYFSGANGGYNDGYDGVGITPDVVEELDEALAGKNIYTITDEEDNQLAKALDCFTK
ncbi:MAG: hypothetical protein E7607_02980 [Ruminococcaceae bacterium]|nr:hypothetical protein [Oscillospiraceae bacterium]